MADGQVLRQLNTGRVEERRENRIGTLCHKSKDCMDIEAHSFCCLSVLIGQKCVDVFTNGACGKHVHTRMG